MFPVPADRLYPLRILLDLPTAHLTRATRAWMETQARETGQNGTLGGSVIDVGNLPHGWYLRVRTDIADRIPADLHACMLKAAELGAHSILFDTDAEDSPATGDLPLYEEDARDTPIAREPYDGPAVGKVEVFVLSSVATDDDAHVPLLPSVFLNEAAAKAAFLETMKSEWASCGPEDEETGERLPIPEGATAEDLHEKLVAFHGTSWGQYDLTSHLVDFTAPPAAGPTPEPARPVVVDPAPTADAPPAGPRILATITPQQWQNNYAVTVDPEGQTSWDVTDEVVAMGREAALALKDNSDASDDLARSPNAPKWIRNWSGPFYVEVADAVTEYYAALDSEALPEAA